MTLFLLDEFEIASAIPVGDRGRRGWGQAPPLHGTMPSSLSLDEFEVAFANPVGDGFVVLTHFPASRRYKMFHKISTESLPGQLTLLEQVGGCRQIAC